MRRENFFRTPVMNLIFFPHELCLSTQQLSSDSFWH